MYYMQIIDEIAPLINIILKIFSDIKWFLVVYIIIIFAFSSSFELLGRNQMKSDLGDMFDENGEWTSDEDMPDYLNSMDAFVHVYFISLGEF